MTLTKPFLKVKPNFKLSCSFLKQLIIREKRFPYLCIDYKNLLNMADNLNRTYIMVFHKQRDGAFVYFKMETKNIVYDVTALLNRPDCMLCFVIFCVLNPMACKR